MSNSSLPTARATAMTAGEYHYVQPTRTLDVILRDLFGDEGGGEVRAFVDIATGRPPTLLLTATQWIASTVGDAAHNLGGGGGGSSSGVNEKERRNQFDHLPSRTVATRKRPRTRSMDSSVATAKRAKTTAAIICPICLEEFKSGEKVTALLCTHEFHSDCLWPWAKEHATCPTCRFESF